MTPISVGDLAQVVRVSTCCGSDGDLGATFTVADVVQAETIHCDLCDKRGLPGDWIAIREGRYGYRMSRLKRIPPLSELESTEETLKVTA